MRLSFELPPPHTHAAVRALVEAVVAALTGQPCALTLASRQELPDQNGGRDTCFTARWTCGAVSWTEEVLSGSGNPRDGFGYDLSAVLVVPREGGELRCTLRDGGYEPKPTRFEAELSGLRGGEWLKLRELLRANVGAKHDRSLAPLYVRDVLEALRLEGDLPAALALARACLDAAGPAQYAREEIIAWLARTDPSAGGATLRTREAPAVLDGWLELEASSADLESTFARLCPFDLARWTAAGLPVAPWFSHPRWPLSMAQPASAEWLGVHLPAPVVGLGLSTKLSQALSGWSVGEHWNDVHGEPLTTTDPSARWHVTRRARFPEGAQVPRVDVTLEGELRDPPEWALPAAERWSRSARETLTFTWVGGPETGDAVLVIERRLPPERQPFVGLAVTIVGSHTFRARAHEALLATTHLRWHPVAAAEALAARTLATLPWCDDAAEPLVLAEAALTAVDALEQARPLLTCRCAQQIGYCEHRRALLEHSRTVRDATPRGQAREAAWLAAFEAVSAQPRPDAARRNARRAHDQLIIAAEWVS